MTLAVRFASIFVLTFFVTGCDRETVGSAVADLDPPTPANPRTVTLSPHLAELVYAIGAGDLLVGVSAYTDYPPEALAVPVIGDAFNLDQERLTMLEPDLLLAWDNGTPQHVIDDLRTRGFRIEVITTTSIGDIPAAMRRIGSLIGRRPGADAAARSFDNTLDAIRETRKGKSPITVFYQVDARPLYTINGEHYLSELIELCGGVNIFDDIGGLAPLISKAAHHGVGEVQVTGVEADLLVDVSTGPVRATGTRGFLNLDTGSGSVDVSDVIGDLRADTGSGSVVVTDVTGDVVLIDTGSGSVEATDIQATRLTVDTGSGSVTLGAIRAEEVLVDTGSGGVEIELLSAVNSLEIDTGSGGVVVYMPADLDAEIEVDTGSGGIDVNFPLTVSEVERTHLVGRIGQGGGRIRIDTGSGSVRLLRR